MKLDGFGIMVGDMRLYISLRSAGLFILLRFFNLSKSIENGSVLS